MFNSNIVGAGVAFLGAAGLTLALTGCDTAGEPAQQVSLSPEAQRAAQIERGAYLANSIGMCTDCHTPRGEGGAFVTEKWLQGATLDFQPIHEMPMWAPVSPPIAGLKVFSREHVVTLLTTGKRPNGTECRPPMPHYSMSTEDAEAIAAYLGSL